MDGMRPKQFSLKRLFAFTAAVAILLSQLPMSEDHDVRSAGAETGPILYSLKLPNLRFWGVVAVYVLIALMWLIYRVWKMPEKMSDDPQGP
jgi:hypothetical protein